MIQDHFLCSSIFKIFHTWSSYFDSKITIYNTLCWYSGKDTGLSPGRPQFKSRHHQGFLQKDLPWKFFKKWLSIRRITVWITSRSQLFPCPAFFMQASNFKDKQTTKENRWSSLGSLTCSGRFAPHKMRVHVMRTTRHFWDNKRPHTTKNIALIFFLHQASALLLFSTCT